MIKINFKNWQKVEEYNADNPAPIYCKAHLSKMGLKPKDENIYAVHQVYNGHRNRWDAFRFYTLDNTVQKRKVKRTAREYEPTPENICEALYTVNKSAKKSRDTAQENYHIGEHGIVARAKTRKNKIYRLKDAVMKKLIADNILELKGYNTQKYVKRTKLRDPSCNVCEDYEINCYVNCEKRYYETKEEEEAVNYLLLYRYKQFSFHAISDKKPSNVEFLSEIEDLISQEVKVKSPIGYNDAVKLLTEYCNASAASDT